MITREQAKEKIADLVKEFLEYSKEDINKKSENQIKSEFIDPLFEALGWDMRKDAEREERVLKGRADYILRIGNQDKLVIEAKKTGVGLNEEEGRQAVSYAHHNNIKFAVLTNFARIRVYHALSNIKHINKNLLKDKTDYLRFNCEDFVKDFDRLWLLSRESFEKGEINKLLQNVDKKLIKPIDEAILTDLLYYREWLSKDLKSKRMQLEDSQIEEVVQILIDRLIFMRSVEDRGLEAKDFLLKIINDVEKGFTEMNLWAVLKAQFQRFDKTYNSKLFQEGLLEKEEFFDNRILAKVIRGLYYGTQDHQERYMFDEIPVDLLGSIYEQYLGVVLRGTEKRVKLDLVSGKRKKMGIYYTPSYIVDYIVSNTIGEYVKDRSLDEILNIKIVDPACGSGSFLIDAFQELTNIVEERLKKGEKSKKYKNTFQEWKGKLSLGEKTTILLNCIYGVDLDKKAVELAQLNLLLKILEEETRETRKRILPNMKNNIKNGNSLISDSRFDKAFNWNAQFPSIKEGGFDIVIGNPPYINNITLPEKDKKFYSKNYLSAYEQYDILVLFFEKGIKLLKNGGLLSFIVSNKFLVAKYGKKLREFLLKETKLINLTDVSNLGVFKDASTYPLILVCERSGSNNENNIITINSKINSEKDFIEKDYQINQIKQKQFKTKQNSVFEIHLQKEDEDIIKKIGAGKIQLSEVLNIRKGIETGGDKKFIISSCDIGSLKSSDKRFLVKLIHSREINRYFIKDSEKYLIYDPSRLKGPRTRDIFEKKKIVTCRTVKRLAFGYDLENRYLTDTNQILLLKDDKFDLKFVLGLLNSKLINYFYSKKFESSHMRGGYFRCFKQYLDQIPMAKPSQKQEKKIVGLADQMIELQNKFHNKKISGNEKERLEQQIKNVDYEIDEEVYKLYGITKEEQKIIEESLK